MPYINCKSCNLPNIFTFNNDLTAFNGNDTCEVCRIKAEASTGRKRVFSPDRIPHLFVHQIQNEAWSSSKNLSFNGANYKSYSTVIASRVTNRKGEVAFLIDVDRHSMTTGRQISDLQRAIPLGTKVMHVSYPQVDNGREYAIVGKYPIDHPHYAREDMWDYRDKKEGKTPDHRRNFEYWRSQVANKLREAAKSREPKKSRLMGEAASEVDNMREYAAFFGITNKVADYPKLPATVAELATMQAANVKRDALAKAKRDKAAKTAQALREIEDKQTMQEWLDGGRNTAPYYMETQLRITGDVVQTSRGVDFPIEHAKRGLALVQAVMSRGEEWRTNGHTCHLGHYKIDRITLDGTVYAGCHVVTFAAINRIAPLLEAWNG
jgi:hypothetical protein